MAGNKDVNSNLNILGKALIYTVPNSQGSVLTYNAFSKEISQRTKAQFVSDLSLATQFWVTSQGYLTSASLNNYVTTNTPQSITGDKTFQGALKTETGQVSFYDDASGYWGKIQLSDDAWLFENSGNIFAILSSGGNLTLFKTNSISANINPQNLTVNRIYNLPNASGTIALQEWVTSQGYITNAALSGYLPLTGGTLSGQLTLSNSGLKFLDNPYGGGGDGASMYISSSGGEQLTLNIEVSNDADDIINLITPSATGLKHNGNTVWDAGNDGAGSGLDADLLDGLDSSNYVTTHTTQTINASKTFIGNTFVQSRFAVKGNDGNDWIVLHGGVRRGVIKDPDGIYQEVRFIGWWSNTDYPNLGNFPYFGFNHPYSRIVVRFNLEQHTDKALAVGGPSYIESISTQSHGDSSQWKQAHNWGDHASAGYATATHTHIISDVAGLQTALDNKENAFAKNTAFNKNFGTTAGTVAEGNHTHSGYLNQSLNIDVSAESNNLRINPIEILFDGTGVKTFDGSLYPHRLVYIIVSDTVSYVNLNNLQPKQRIVIFNLTGNRIDIKEDIASLAYTLSVGNKVSVYKIQNSYYSANSAIFYDKTGLTIW